MFYSTRNASLSCHASLVILKGLSEEGGLFLPKEIPAVSVKDLVGKSYPEIAFKILRCYLDDFSDAEIKDAIAKAYGKENFPQQPMAVTSFPDVSFLELFHGQTLTFKDMALSLLPHLMSASLAKHPDEKKIHILTATSGDTGSAVLASFRNQSTIPVSVLYPQNGIAPIQEKQMLSFTSPKGRAYALQNSNFDDCQNLVKALLNDPKEKGRFSSANSINAGRLLPQIVYYYAAYLEMVANKTIQLGDKIDVVVPTGNFGDIFAGYLAKRMSLPIRKLVVASNENKVLTDFFKTGTYSIRRTFKKTNSPSMDILISSNLERLLYLSCLDDKQVSRWEMSLKTKKYFRVSPEVLAKLQQDFVAYSADEKETDQAIRDCFHKNHYLLDPHTAVGYACSKKYCKENKALKVLVVATASPLKFPETILNAFGKSYVDNADALAQVLALMKQPLPSQLEAVLKAKVPCYPVTLNSFKKLLAEKPTYEVTSPATSANLGPGFDVCGICLNLANVFRFTPSEKDTLIGFKGKEEIENNLVLSSYHRFFGENHYPYQPVTIRQVKQGVPVSRGLGSSASCIVAGLLAANEITHRPLTKLELLKLATLIEGHPDNVAPCLYGNLVAAFRKDDGEMIPMGYPVSDQLGFLLIIPNFELSTKLAREALKKEYPLADVTYDASRLIHLPYAFEEGSTVLLEDLLKDRIHYPYRMPLIPNSQVLEGLAKQYHLPFTLSGAGSTLLVLFRKDNKKPLQDFKKAVSSLKLTPKVTLKELSLNSEGATLKEV
jgi:threonine synthase